MIPKQELYQRVANLSSNQRAELLQQIRQLKAENLPSSPSNQSLQNHQRLVAYIVPHSFTTNLDSSVLRDYMKAKLPNYMLPAGIMFLEALPRTANGKIDIKALPKFELTTLNSEQSNAPQNFIEKTLAKIWSQVLSIDNIGIHDNFFELGGDSILSIQITSQAREAGLRLSPNQLFEQPTIAELATVVNMKPEAIATQVPITGLVPLTPIQHWFFEQKMIAPQHWHQASLIEISAQLSLSEMQKAITMLWTHHDALRLNFSFEATGWQQINRDETTPPSVLEVDISYLSETEQIKTIAEYGTKIHSNMNLAEGKLISVAYFYRGENLANWLLISLHHLVVDAVSWQILHQDLDKLLNQNSDSQSLPAKTTAFKTWAEILTNQASRRQSTADFWFQQVELPFIRLPQDNVDTLLLTEATAQTRSVKLNPNDTQALLQSLPAIYHTQINDILLTALAKTLLQWVGVKQGNVRFDVEVHGREQIVPEIDLSRTVGWLTSFYPLTLKLTAKEDYGVMVKSVKEQIREISDRIIDYGILSYLGNKSISQRLAQAPKSQILFNYLGQLNPNGGKENLQLITDIPLGELRDAGNCRHYLLEINAWVADGQLQLNWTYDQQVYQLDTINQVAKNYLEILTNIISQAQKSDHIGFSPTDFPDVDFNQAELDQFIDHIT